MIVSNTNQFSNLFTSEMTETFSNISSVPPHKETTPLLPFQSTQPPPTITDEEHLIKQDSMAGAIFNLANSTIGAGVLGLPYVMHETGVVTGFLFIILGAVMSCISLILLQRGLYVLGMK